MSFRSLEQGIAAIQQGNKEEGARLLRIALRSGEIQGSLRATALLWMAETKTDQHEKVELYNQALAADPGNEHAKQRIALLLSQGLPPTPAPQTSGPEPSTPTPVTPAQGPPASVPGQPERQQPSPGTTQVPYQGQGMPATQTATHTPASQRPRALNFNPELNYRSVGILGGPNGPGTGFFVTRDGLIATTRFVVGGEQQVTVELDPGNAMTARVVRAYVDLDLAFIHTGLAVNHLSPPYSAPTLADNEPLTAYAHNQRAMSGYRRATKSDVKANWFPTTISELNDAGGNPIFNDNHLLVGMLTHNANRTSPYVFGLFIGTILRYVEHYAQELRAGDGKLVYCPGCGYLSRAGGAGGFYCEACGSVLPHAESVRRSPQPRMSSYYGEQMQAPCPSCNARVGYYDRRCLRCGYDTRAQQLR